MANQPCHAGSEAQCDALQATINKALAYPSVGTHVGGGIHVDMPASWDGQGPTPLGWTKHAVPVLRLNSATAWVPIPDELAAVLQGAPAQALLTVPERAQLNGAIAGRVPADPGAQGATPKANAAQGAAQKL